VVAGFSRDKSSTAPARFDPKELEGLNAKLLHELPFEAVADRLEALGIAGGGAFWSAVRGNLEVFEEVRGWWQVVDGTIAPVIEEADAAYVGEALGALPEGGLDAGSWGRWTSALKASSGRKGRALFHPLRLALTGRGSGPDMAELLPLIGREKAARRLAGQTA